MEGTIQLSDDNTVWNSFTEGSNTSSLDQGVIFDNSTDIYTLSNTNPLELTPDDTLYWVYNPGDTDLSDVSVSGTGEYQYQTSLGKLIIDINGDIFTYESPETAVTFTVNKTDSFTVNVTNADGTKVILNYTFNFEIIV